MNNSRPAAVAIPEKNWRQSTFFVQPFASHYPRLMALRSRLIGWLV